jgi:hypothetical protein
MDQAPGHGPVAQGVDPPLYALALENDSKVGFISRYISISRSVRSRLKTFVRTVGRSRFG